MEWRDEGKDGGSTTEHLIPKTLQQQQSWGRQQKLQLRVRMQII